MMIKVISYFTFLAVVLASFGWTAQPLVRVSQENAAAKPEWDELKRGSILQGLEFKADGTLWLHSPNGIVFLHPGWDTSQEKLELILFPQTSNTKRYQVIVGDIYIDGAAWVLDRNTNRLEQLPFWRYVHQGYAWSPDDQYLLFESSYEDRSSIYVVELPKMAIREVRRKGLAPFDKKVCCGLLDWAEDEYDASFIDSKSLRWINNNRAEFDITVICNPYVCPDENVNKPSKLIHIVIDISNNQVIEQLIEDKPNQ